MGNSTTLIPNLSYFQKCLCFLSYGHSHLSKMSPTHYSFLDFFIKVRTTIMNTILKSEEIQDISVVAYHQKVLKNFISFFMYSVMMHE